MNKARLITLGVVIVLIAAALPFISMMSPTKPRVGTSTNPQLDIVSGEVTPNDGKIIASNLGVYTNKDISDSDFSIRSGSYKKTYTDSTTYTVTMLVDTKNPVSTYQVAVEHNPTSSDNVIVSCADAVSQISNSTCVDMTDGGE